ncbi:MAG: hypothetical protein WCP29_11020 [Acidobacteriota bacterium]
MRTLRAAGLLVSLILALPLGHTASAQTPGGLVGSWLANEGALNISLVINADGTGRLDDAPIRYVVSGNALTVTESGVVNRYTFTLNGNALTLAGGDLDRAMNFKRQGGTSAGLGARRSGTAAPLGGQAGGTASAGPASTVQGPQGNWETEGQNGPLRLSLRADGTGTFGPGSVRWQFSQGVLTLTGPNGTPVTYNAAFAGSTMTISGGGMPQPVIFRAVGIQGGGSASAPSAPPAAPAPPRGAGPTVGSQSATGLVGSWQGPQGVTQIKADGTMLIQGTPYRYAVQGNTLTLVGNDGTLPIPFQLNGDTLTVSINGQTAVLTRMAANAPTATPGGGGSSIAELAGKWCYFSNFSANSGGGSMSNECFVINANGTYAYHREGSMSAYAPGMYGGTASQTDDRGTVQLQGSTLMVTSQSQGPASYTLVKRNDQKTGDAMLCLDGRCYVTAYNRPPWR